MQRIDLDQWPRKEIFTFFSRMSYPFYSVSFQVDVTGVYDYVKPRGLSFYLALCWLVCQALNRVENFRYSIDQGEVWLLDGRKPSFTDIRKGEELFYIVTAELLPELDDFCRAARAQSGAQRCFIDDTRETQDLVYLSCVPTVDMTAITGERDFDPDDTIPRVTWGKYIDKDGRKTLNMTLEVNHRTIDGYHIGRFAAELDGLITGLAGKN